MKRAIKTAQQCASNQEILYHKTAQKSTKNGKILARPADSLARHRLCRLWGNRNDLIALRLSNLLVFEPGNNAIVAK